MGLRLVYRTLRKFSDWALMFYSEVHVDGIENVPQDGPLIVVACHHNELLDIATLAVTIPHRRPLCFWAKSSLFKNPLARAILLSSGAIPVHRNPDGAAKAAAPENNGSSSLRETLFAETFRALDSGDVIGVFPEGTSYTMPQIIQVKEGAALAALEYIRWQRHNTGNGTRPKDLVIIPVGIVHTDKSQYQSRMCVRWGAPINIATAAEEYIAGGGSDRSVVRALTDTIEKRMVQLTINAPDWDTLHAARMARDIIWDDEQNIPARQIVIVTQFLIDMFTNSSDIPSQRSAKRALLKYYSLLYYTSISHPSLTAILPDPLNFEPPTIGQAVMSVVRQIAITLLHPRFLVFFPPFVLHVPAYILAASANRFLATAHEEETHAQFKAIFGGIGAGTMYALAGRAIARFLLSSKILGKLKEMAHTTAKFDILLPLSHSMTSIPSSIKSSLAVASLICGTVVLMSKWHNLLIHSNLTQMRRLITSWKVVTGLLSPTSTDLTPEELMLYETPPRPPINPYVKHRQNPEHIGQASHTHNGSVRDENAVHDIDYACPATPSSSRIIRPLLEARIEATTSLQDFLADWESQHGFNPVELYPDVLTPSHQ
ncbi:acyltransferase [Wolfiporia cocos MD-104 SS10]|uniref:Acyltransferase n=1 Tax=Wolfiporia cocos (strain MD-104) TaxID=742152 RepID=A0A2H3J9Q5_WOLCO|nr:acyltransferase [Wolfiporia cocos MD-104 SS10]